MRILNIVESLDKGAVENWLVNVFIESRKTRPQWEWTFYCILGKEGRLDEKVKEAGGKIIYSPSTVSAKWKFLQSLRKTVKDGSYDIIHSHHDFLSGFYLPAIVGFSFKKRILHIHNTDEAVPVGNRKLEKFLRKPLKWLAIHFSDVIVGISKDTLQQFTENKFFNNKKTALLYYGIDMISFSKEVDRSSLRNEFDLPAESKLLLFSGRMNIFKNPLFVLDILKELLQKDKNYYALFVGQGDLTKEVELKAAEYGISEHIRLPGWRNDLPSVMKSCDVFVFPRVEKPKEGLGLVVVEAQAAGLPMVLSYGVVPDAIELNALATFMPLKDNAADWASKIALIKKEITPQDALQKMMQSKFALPLAAANLINLYET